MISKVKQTIKRYNLVKKGECVVVALSGGPDSTALLMALYGLSREMELALVVAHFNHGLRGRESKEDEKFCCHLARKLGLPFHAGRMEKKNITRGISPEDFFRRQRYGFLEKVAEKHHAQKIALGHHLQDQAETVLLNVLRGSGLEGMKGILPNRNESIIRPLIEVTRDDIITFLKKSGVPYRCDRSNENTMYLRNKIRAELIPYLKEKYNPRIEETLAQTAEILRKEDKFIKYHVDNVLSKSIVKKNARGMALKINVVREMDPAIRWRLFKTFLEDLTPEKKGISFAHVKALEDLIQSKASGKKVVLPANIEARKEYDILFLEKRRNVCKAYNYEYVLAIPGTIYIKELETSIRSKMIKRNKMDLTNKNKMYFDLDKIELPLRVRNRRRGDWFQPLGVNGRQKIKKYFIDHKITRMERDRIALLTDGLSVIGVSGMNLDDRVKVTSKTKNILAVEFSGGSPRRQALSVLSENI